ncbi:cold shock protein CspA [Weissella oryzae SG25]|uniref:Cold shock protein CspA n=1 Tax=Weissella oryzae (strain DSM 25784 / JCM 18191 / LMG 30913 / SG25) TaxID=1329250 RepID=A0A069CZL3_WEIOS|nr:cold shock domain-containing protein [Weissella oryzae]GAK30541.1 cold shock protein CspA [Weissella oryzae SG25]
MQKIDGIVKTWNSEKGFGFIEVKNEDDVFVHFSGIESAGVRDLLPGSEVKLMIVSGVRGPQAAGVEVVTDEG